MSTSLEQKYFEMLTRIDHPVFLKDFSATTDQNSPLNSIFNRIFARQLVYIRTLLQSVILNSFPNTVDANTIDQWEMDYFGFIKAGQPLSDRISQLLIKYNNFLRMNVPSVIYLAQSITGLTPTVIRSFSQGGWILDQSVLDKDTILAASAGQTGNPNDAQTYTVIFGDPVDSASLALLDSELTKIEKGGSKHIIINQPSYWILDKSSLDTNSILG